MRRGLVGPVPELPNQRGCSDYQHPVLDGPDVLKLTTIRSHNQYNTTIYGLDDRYRGVFGRRDILFASERDLATRNIEHGDLVDVESAIPGCEHKRVRLTAIVHDIASGSVGAYYPEANNLCPLGYQDPESGTPCYKSIPVRIRWTDQTVLAMPGARDFLQRHAWRVLQVRIAFRRDSGEVVVRHRCV